jgi:LmbE family N-acetylglucosaminyl deacetylase
MAHPDDESFGIGALIAKYVAEGVEVTLICTTNGDVGTVDPEHLKGYNSIAELRLAELHCAADVLGFKEVIPFGYRDSGMMGTPENDDPLCSWQAPHDEITQKVVDVIRRVKPQVIVTFDPFGGYGHPDHIKINKATLAAFKITQNDPDGPQKLYYPSFPRFMIRFGVTMMQLTGGDPRHMGRNKDMDAQAILDATLPTHTRVDVSHYIEIGQKASACHASQMMTGQDSPLVALFFRLLSSKSNLTRVEPPPILSRPAERDLFIGVLER